MCSSFTPNSLRLPGILRSPASVRSPWTAACAAWRSRAGYESFRKEQAQEYVRLDELCEKLTLHERILGTVDDGK